MLKKSKLTDAIILIKQKKLGFVHEYLCDLEDIIYASKIQLNMEPNFVNQNADLILTYGFIYIFIKESKKPKLIKQINLFQCQDIKLDNSNDPINANITIKINQNTSHDFIKFSKRKIKKAKIRDLYNKISYAVCIISNNLSAPFAIPNFDPPAPIKPLLTNEVLYRRSLYFIYCDIKEGKRAKSNLEGCKYFNDQQIIQDHNLIIRSSFHPGDFSNYYGKAINYESQISKVVFDNFNDSKMTDLIESIISPLETAPAICFSGYKIYSPAFNFEKVTKLLEAIEFSDSNFNVVKNFIRGCRNYSYDIKKIDISSLLIQPPDLAGIFDDINKTNCFNNLESFSLSNMKLGSFPFESFENFLNSQEKLESLTISKIDVDGSKLLHVICKSEPQIYELHLNYLDFQTPLQFEDNDDIIGLPYNLTLIDFSHSKFSSKSNSLKPVLELLTSSSIMNTIYMVDMSYLEPFKNTFENVFKSLDLNKIRPNIGDFNYSGNMLCTNFFDFVLTQKKLQILSLNECRVKFQDKMYFAVLNLFKELKNLIGIEFGFEQTNPNLIEPFLASCKEFKQIEHFYFNCQEGQDKIAINIAELISSLPNIKEVSLNMPKLSIEAYLKLIGSICNSKSILACNFCRCEEKSENVTKLHNTLQSRNLKKSTTMSERASLLISQKKENENMQNVSIDITTTIRMKNFEPEIQYDVNDEDSFSIEIEEEEEELD